MATPDSVIAKLQVLKDLSNITTNKNNPDVTSAVKSLIDGYSKGGVPIEVLTEAEMTALLETAGVGSVYKYGGTSGTYESGTLYIVEESE